MVINDYAAGWGNAKLAVGRVKFTLYNLRFTI